MPDTNLIVRKRIYRAQLGAYLLIIIVGLLGFWRTGEQQDDLEADQVASCESTNDTRAGQRKVWTFFFTVTKANAESQDQPKAVIDFYNNYLRWITEEVFPPRDCSDLTKEYSDPLPPPSFKEALEEAKKQEAREERWLKENRHEHDSQ